MVPSKSQSQAQFVLDLYAKLFEDLQQRYPGESKSLARDLETLRSRVTSEGLSFVTRILPKLGKAFDASLDTGRLEVPREFKRSHGNRAIPAFLQAMLSLCYGPDGQLGMPDSDVIRDVRQVCYLVYKLEIPFTKSQEDAVIQRFLDTEEEISSAEITLEEPVLLGAQRALRIVFEGFDPRDITPRHGPGAVATGEKLEQKWCFKRLYDPIHQSYPYYDYFVVGGATELSDRIEWYRGLQRQDVGVAKVVLVPKDSRGPRLISCEPLEYQWIQQGLNQALTRRLESHWLTRGHVNFKDQSVNRQLAVESSTHHYYATLDLKDASDRVSVKLVEKLFSKELIRYLMAVRSHATLLPDGRVVPLSKYAPMGSAVCFSVEAACFWAICVAAVRTELGVTLSEAAQHVYVYGDDLIVPVSAYDAVVRALEACLLRVNGDKSFRRGDFRESCGMDAYYGADVTPTRLSTLWSLEPSDGGCLASYTAYANDFMRKGYTNVAEFLFGSLREVHGVIPRGTHRAGYPCRVVVSYEDALAQNLELGVPFRYNPALQRVEFRVRALRPKHSVSELDGWPRLLRQLVGAGGERPEEVAHPRSARIQRRWMTA